LSEHLKLCPQGDAARVRGWFAAAALPTGFNELPELGVTEDDLVELMKQDKKAVGGKLVFVLARGIGQAFVARDVDEAPVKAILRDALRHSKVS
jgi:3-dehydroquinate synthetase